MIDTMDLASSDFYLCKKYSLLFESKKIYNTKMLQESKLNAEKFDELDVKFD